MIAKNKKTANKTAKTTGTSFNVINGLTIVNSKLYSL